MAFNQDHYTVVIKHSYHNANELNQKWRLEGKNYELDGADLSGRDLSNFNLSRASLIGANLSSANLYNVKLINTNLSKANLTKAKNLNLIVDVDGVIFDQDTKISGNAPKWMQDMKERAQELKQVVQLNGGPDEYELLVGTMVNGKFVAKAEQQKSNETPSEAIGDTVKTAISNHTLKPITADDIYKQEFQGTAEPLAEFIKKAITAVIANKNSPDYATNKEKARDALIEIYETQNNNSDVTPAQRANKVIKLIENKQAQMLMGSLNRS